MAQERQKERAHTLVVDEDLDLAILHHTDTAVSSSKILQTKLVSPAVVGLWAQQASWEQQALDGLNLQFQLLFRSSRCHQPWLVQPRPEARRGGTSRTPNPGPWPRSSSTAAPLRIELCKKEYSWGKSEGEKEEGIKRGVRKDMEKESGRHLLKPVWKARSVRGGCDDVGGKDRRV